MAERGRVPAPQPRPIPALPRAEAVPGAGWAVGMLPAGPGAGWAVGTLPARLWVPAVPAAAALLGALGAGLWDPLAAALQK